MNSSYRQYIIQVITVLVAVVFLTKLFFLQVLDEDYKLEAESNAIRKIIEHPDRGLIKDRTGKLIVANMPVHDIYIIPKDFKIKDTLRFCELFDLTKEELINRYQKLRKSKDYSYYSPMLFIKHLPESQYLKIADKLDEFEGLEARVRTLRQYPHQSLANALGYVSEIDEAMLKRDSSQYYKQGDMIGRTGIELSYEQELRGTRGVKHVMVNARHIIKDRFEEGKHDIDSEVGDSLISSIDLDLQQFGEKLMSHKIGSIVAIEPATGEILAMVSAPSYDPNALIGSEKEFTKEYFKLASNKLKPLYNRPVMAFYPPGSIFKIVQALIGLQEGVIDSATTRIACVQDVVKCHAHPSPLDVKSSIQYSCNPFYLKVFNRIIIQDKSKDYYEDTKIGLAKWHDYVTKFGFGHKLGSDILEEKAGNMPSVAYYNKRFKGRKWKFGNIYSLSIGQGEMGVTPLQMANMAATIANRGYYYIPHIIKDINGQGALPKFREKHETGIKKEYFNLVVNAMADVVRAGTARRAQVQGITVCGKTGTAQNPHGEDHSVFIAFAPKDNPKIAIAVYVENAGWGGSWAAPIAGLMIEKYLKGSINDPARQKLVEEISQKDFITPMENKIKKIEASREAAATATTRRTNSREKGKEKESKSNEPAISSTNKVEGGY